MATILSRTVGTATSLYNRALKASRRGRWPLTLGVRVAVLDAQDNVLLGGGDPSGIDMRAYGDGLEAQEFDGQRTGSA